MKLVVGLGNPGNEYASTRHNVGFMAIDEVAKGYNVDFKLDKSMKGMIAQVNNMGKKAILLKPMTYMNLSGEAVSAVARYYSIDIEDIIVINDDLDLPCGKVRFRLNGSAGGHNGLKSINNHLKSQDYKRIKIGIDKSPIIPVVDYVLGKFTEGERVDINHAIEKVVKSINSFINEEDYTKIASHLNI